MILDFKADFNDFSWLLLFDSEPVDDYGHLANIFFNVSLCFSFSDHPLPMFLDYECPSI